MADVEVGARDVGDTLAPPSRMRPVDRVPWLGIYLALLTIALLMPADREWHAHREPVWLSAGRDLPLDVIVQDAAVNVVAFLPFGALLYLRSQRPRGLLTTILAAAGFALVMETGQYLLAWRESSILDVLSETTGAIAGWALAALTFEMWYRRAVADRSREQVQASIPHAAWARRDARPGHPAHPDLPALARTKA